LNELMIDIAGGRILLLCWLSAGSHPDQDVCGPLELLNLSTHDKKFLLNVPREVLVKSAGYDTVEQVVEKADTYWLGDIYEYYSHKTGMGKEREDERQSDVQKTADEKRGDKESLPQAGG